MQKTFEFKFNIKNNFRFVNFYFIKIPYYLEGVYHGIIGSVISISFLYLFYDFFNSISIYTFKIQSIDFLQLSLVNILLGIILGFLGSSKALSSYVED